MNSNGFAWIIAAIAIILVVGGIAAAITVGNWVTNQAQSFEFMPTLQGYALGVIVAIALIVAGVILLFLILGK